MKCPGCGVAMVVRELVPGLQGHECGGCHGVWVRGEKYYAWIEKGGMKLGAGEPARAGAPAADGVKARLCCDCGRLLGRYEVGKGTGFRIERCGTCAGMFLDAREFEALLARDLADKIHFVFSAAWQAELLRQRQEADYQDLLLEKLGEADMAEARRVKTWLAGHKHRGEILAYLSK